MDTLIIVLLIVSSVSGLIGGWKLYERITLPRALESLESRANTLKSLVADLDAEKSYYSTLYLAFSNYYPAQHSEVVQRVEDMEWQEAQYADTALREEKYRAAQLRNQEQMVNLQERRFREESWRDDRRRR